VSVDKGDDVAEDGRALAVARQAALEPLDWDGIGAIVVLLVAATSLHDWVSDASIGVFLLRVLWVLMYLAAATRLVQRFGTEWLTWTVRHEPALCVLLALTFASYFWSLAPLLTLHKAASLLGTTVLGVFIGYNCPPLRVMRLLQWTFTLLIVSSIVVALAFPVPLAAGQPIGWLGIMSHKNDFGAAAVLATIFFLVVTLRRRIHPLWGAALCALCLVAVVQAHSRTSFVALGISLVALAYLAIAKATRRPTRVVLQRMSLGLVLGVSVMPFLVGPLAAALGSNDPLNGRTAIWAGALAILRERPLTGYGYAVVWGRAAATLLPHIAITAHRSAANAHNSIVNVATELGIPAAIVASVYLFGAFSNAVKLFEQEPSPFSSFALVFLVGITVTGVAEAHLLRIHSMFWILFIALTVTVKRSLRRIAAVRI
jgi:O-antigen ligase